MPNNSIVNITSCCGLSQVSGFGSATYGIPTAGDLSVYRYYLRTDPNRVAPESQLMLYGVVTNVQLSTLEHAQRLKDDGWITVARWKNVNSNNYCNLIVNPLSGQPIDTREVNNAERVLFVDHHNTPPMPAPVQPPAPERPQTVFKLLRYRFDDDGMVDPDRSVVIGEYPNRPTAARIREVISQYKAGFTRTPTDRMRFGIEETINE